MAKCRSCDAEIIWMITSTGKRIPADANDAARKAQQAIRDSAGYGVSPTFVPKYHQSHFATCPNADDHRKVKR